MALKQLGIKPATHEMLKAIKDKRKEEVNPASSFADILHELVSKAFKKEIKK